MLSIYLLRTAPSIVLHSARLLACLTIRRTVQTFSHSNAIACKQASRWCSLAYWPINKHVQVLSSSIKQQLSSLTHLPALASLCLAYTVYGHTHKPGSTVVARRGEHPMSISLFFPLSLWSPLYFPPCLCLYRATSELYESSTMVSSMHEARRKLMLAC
jgi:hypothetical protein